MVRSILCPYLIELPSYLIIVPEQALAHDFSLIMKARTLDML